MPSSVPAVKAGLKQLLVTTPGLRPADGFSVRTADPDPREMTTHQVVLGQVVAPRSPAGLNRHAEAGTLTATIWVVKVGVGDTAADQARADVYAALAAVAGAVKADPTAGGTVPDPGRLEVTSHTLDEFPVDWDGSAARKAQLQVQIGWTSHIL